MTDQTLDQCRAKHALEQIKQRKRCNRQSDYLSYVKALPASILQNGLGQAMATLRAAAGEKPKADPHYLLYQDVQAWLCRNEPDAPYHGKKDLLEAITQHGEPQYLHARDEALRYLDWLKKLAAAHLEADGSPS